MHRHSVFGTCGRTESSDLLSVLDELDPDTLSDSGVGLLGLNTDLLEDDALGVGRATERRGLESGSQKTLLEGQIGPALLTAVVAQLAGGVETSWLSYKFCVSGCTAETGASWFESGIRGRSAERCCVPLPMFAVLTTDCCGTVGG
jgi:hypothetical protein